jgi:ABC-type branched-subunit amino acid transport system substrate-binding protein
MKNNSRLSIAAVLLSMVLIIYFFGLQPGLAAEAKPEGAAKEQPAVPAGDKPAEAVNNQAAAPGKDQPAAAAETKPAKTENDKVVIGLNAPELGPYGKQGLDQRRAAEMAVEEINAAGGIMGKKIELVYRDPKSNPRLAKENAMELFDKFEAQMIFGGVSSPAALVVGRVARAREKLFFATLAYSTDLTVEEGHMYLFRECSDSGMAARALSGYLKKNFGGKRYFYVTTDSNWGWTTEDVFRKVTDTTDKENHRGFLTKAGDDDFKNVLNLAQELNSEVLVLTLFGRDLEIAAKQAQEMGLKKKMQIVVPNMTIDMAEGAGPEAMEGILSTTPWYWKLPFEENYPKGVEFVKKFEEKYKRYPTTSGASAYVILYQYKEAVERAKTFETAAVIKALENHKYTGLKDEQEWRGIDHQSMQTVYAVRMKKADEVKKDKYQMDYYEVINKVRPQEAAITKEDWSAIRAAVSASPALE